MDKINHCEVAKKAVSAIVIIGGELRCCELLERTSLEFCSIDDKI